MPVLQSLLLLSDAAWLAFAGTGLALVAVIGALGERRRRRREHIDAVGWMPWTTLSFFAAFGAILVLALAVKSWAAG